MNNLNLGRNVFVALAAMGIGISFVQCTKEAAPAGQKAEETVKPAASQPAANTPASATQADVVFSGGHDTDPRDRGRPVILVASALGVPPEVFREAFSHVTPAAAGQEPDPGQVQLNKQALMSRLGPLGVNNERLDEVSNYYRYPPGRGNMWKNRPAKAQATIKDGQVTGIVVTDGGAGYSSPPEVSVTGMTGVKLKATIWYGKDLTKNGSVEKIELEK